MKNITYIFSKNRKKNYNNKKSNEKEIYYGMHNIDNKNNNSEVIEFRENKS